MDTYLPTSPRTLQHTRGALGPGAEVWFVPHSSKWTSKIDWHLNFQFSRIRKKAKKKVPVSVVSQKIFPAQQVIQLPPLKNKAWVQQMYDLWQALGGQLKARVFLPPGLEAQSFKQHLSLCPGATSYADTRLIDLIEDNLK